MTYSLPHIAIQLVHSLTAGRSLPKITLLAILSLGTSSAFAQQLGIRFTTAPSLQSDFYSLDIAPSVNTSLGAVFIMDINSRYTVSTGIDLSVLRTRGYFPSCGLLNVIVSLSEIYYLIEVPIILSIDLGKRQAETNPKAFSFGVSMGKMLNTNEYVDLSNFLGAQLGYTIWHVRTKHLQFKLGTSIKATRITKQCSPGFAISPGLQVVALKR